MPKVDFDVMKAIREAWDFLWQQNLKKRKNEKLAHWQGQSYYLTATDIERRVRLWGQNTHDGKPWEKESGYSYSGGYQYGWKFKGNLQQLIRGWLLKQVHDGHLDYHNFGRGHISGARFRPKGEPMGPAEITTMVKREEQRTNPKPRLCHYSKDGYSGRPKCTEARRSQFSRHRSRVACSNKKGEVTCKRCLKLIKNIPAEALLDSSPANAAVM